MQLSGQQLCCPGNIQTRKHTNSPSTSTFCCAALGHYRNSLGQAIFEKTKFSKHSPAAVCAGRQALWCWGMHEPRGPALQHVQPCSQPLPGTAAEAAPVHQKPGRLLGARAIQGAPEVKIRIRLEQQHAQPCSQPLQEIVAVAAPGWLQVEEVLLIKGHPRSTQGQEQDQNDRGRGHLV
eukprot:1142912-Pelagomonas_calceolata.AAC.11